MTKPEIKELLISILVNEMGVFKDQIKEEATLEDMGLDSLDSIELTMICEKKFHINFDDSEIPTTITFDGIVNLIHETKN